MGNVAKINFPYFLKPGYLEFPENERIVVFFGTDFYNLPLDSDRQLFIEATNKMLRYIEKYLPGRRMLYQPHPNEKDEYGHLDLGRFVIGERSIAEILLNEKAAHVEYVFSACSGSCISGYAMGFNAAVFFSR